MIARYNFRQTLLAVLSFCVGACAFVVTWFFFKFAIPYVIRRLGGNVSHLQEAFIAWGCVGLIALSGFLRWRSGGGFHHFHESGMMLTTEPHTGLGLKLHTEANRVAAWSYLLGQVFLAGPLHIFRAFSRLRLRIPQTNRLEAELLAFRDELRAKNRWMQVSDYPGREEHVMYLARLGLIDYSPRKGALRAR